MSNLVSGRVLKTPSANVSAERYDFISLSETEPDLGVPPANGYVITSDPEGKREWVDLATTLANSNVFVGNLTAAGTIFGNGLIVQNIDILDAIIGETTLANNIFTVNINVANAITSNVWNNLYTANVIETDGNLYYTNDRVQSHITGKVSIGDLRDVANIYTYDSNIGEELIGIQEGQALVWDGNVFIPVFVNSEVANVADLAARVLSLENFTTANVKEAESNLYFTNTRVIEALVGSDVELQNLTVQGDLTVQGNTVTLNVAELFVEDKNIVIANGAPTASAADGAGITVDGANAKITFYESIDGFEINKNLEVQGNILAGAGVGGSITGANLISAEAIYTNYVETDSLLSNTIVSEEVTANVFNGNLQASFVVTPTIESFSGNIEDLTSNSITANSVITIDLNTENVSGNTAVFNTSISNISIAETVFANIVANTVITDQLITGNINTAGNIELVSGDKVFTLNTDGDLIIPEYIEFKSQTRIGDDTDTSAFRVISSGNISLESDNKLAVFDTFGNFSIPEILTSNALVSNLLSITGIAQVNGFDVLTSELTEATFEPMGHENRTASQISFDANTRQFTIEPTGEFYNIWVKGVKFVKTGTESVILPDETDLYYIYFDVNGNIAARGSYFDWQNDAPTAYIYYNANTQSAPFFADERHGITLDWATHEYLHRTRGAVIAEGFSIGNFVVNGDGSSDSHAQIDIGNGVFFDEDLEVAVTHSNTPTPNTWEQDLQGPAQIPMFYLNGTEWVRDEPTDFPLKQGTSRIKYNLLSGGQWTTPDVPTDGLFTTTWIIATNNINYPILAIMGQSANDTVGEEEAINFQDLILTNFPVIEFRPLYKIIWAVNTGFANTPKAIIRKIYDLRNIISASPSAAIASDHGLLSGLGDDDHGQYLHIENARTVTASHTFTGTQTFANILVNNSMVGNLTGQVSDISNHSINALSDVNITDILPGQIITWDGNKFVPGAADQALFSERANVAELSNVSLLANFANVANIANTVVTISNFNTDDLNEGNTNLYFTEQRAIESFTAGKNITILENGVISSTAYSDFYSLQIDGTVSYNITDTLSSAVIFPTLSPTNRFGLRSILVTNISDELAYFDANVVYDESGNSIILAHKIPVPVGGFLELISKTQIFQPGDSIEFQSFDSDKVPTSNLLSTVITYETLVDDPAFVGTGVQLSTGDTPQQVYESSQSYTVLESIKLINIQDYIVSAKVWWADANSDLKAYYVYNLPLPPNSSVEILQKPKRINLTDKLFASYSPNSSVSVFVSGRYGEYFVVENFTTGFNIADSSNIVMSINTTSPEGTIIYYTVE